MVVNRAAGQVVVRRAPVAACAAAGVAFFVGAGLADAKLVPVRDRSGRTVMVNTPQPQPRKAAAVVSLKTTASQDVASVFSARRHQYAPWIQEASRAFSLEPRLIEAVIQVESGFDPAAVSRKGAQGLMQLMPQTAADMGVADAFDPRQNILGGSRYLRQMLDQFGGDLTLSLAAYNSGPHTVRRFQSVPPIQETRDYVRRIGWLLGDLADALDTTPTTLTVLQPQREPGGVSGRPVRQSGRGGMAMAVKAWRDSRGVLHVSNVPTRR